MFRKCQCDTEEYDEKNTSVKNEWRTNHSTPTNKFLKTNQDERGVPLFRIQFFTNSEKHESVWIRFINFHTDLGYAPIKKNTLVYLFPAFLHEQATPEALLRLAQLDGDETLTPVDGVHRAAR